jgi:arylsulfatase A-like enzyme
MYRTFLHLVGGSPPHYSLDGFNMMPYLTGQTDKSPRNTYAYFLGGHLQALRVGNWKLKLNDGVQLFNLAVDVGEHYNRAKEKPEIVKQIRKKMDTVPHHAGVEVSNSGKQ